MNADHGRLISILKQEETALEDLYGILIKELVALKERDTDSLNKLTEKKNAMLNNLGVIDKERQLFVETETNNVTFTNEITSLSNDIEECLNKCKKQNSINGGIIEMSQLFNEKILNIICGNSEEPTTYSATGKNISKNNQNSRARV